MKKLIKPKGTIDYKGVTLCKLEYIKKTIENIFETINFEKILTPAFENSELFYKNIDNSEIVTDKQIFDLYSKSKNNYSLKPEQTQSVIRSLVEDGELHTKPFPIKYYYFDRMYRYERPQKNRYREFYQSGLELIGTKQMIPNTVDIIFFAIKAIFIELGIDLSRIKIKYNYLGTKNDINQKSKNIKEILTKHKDSLTLKSQKTLEKNPLRLLDTKDLNDKKVIQKYIDFLPKLPPSTKFESIFKNLNFSFEFDNQLVRGLDYYEHYVFEIINTETGQAIAGGGNYNFLELKDIHNGSYYCFGFSFGIERLLDLVSIDLVPKKIIVILEPNLIYNKSVQNYINKMLEKDKFEVTIDEKFIKNIKTNVSRLRTKNYKKIILIKDEKNFREINIEND